MKGFSAHQLFLTISGSGRFRRLGSDKDKWDILTSGNLLYIPAGCAHEYRPQDGEAWHVSYVTFLENFGNTLTGWGFRDMPRLLAVNDIGVVTGAIHDRGLLAHLPLLDPAGSDFRRVVRHVDQPKRFFRQLDRVRVKAGFVAGRRQQIREFE